MSLLFGIYLNITPFYYVGYFLFCIYTAYSLYPFYSSVAQCTFFLHLFIVAYKSCGWLFEASRFFRFPFDFHIYFFLGCHPCASVWEIAWNNNVRHRRGEDSMEGCDVVGAVCLYILIDDCQPKSQNFAAGRSLNCLGLSHAPMG